MTDYKKGYVGALNDCKTIVEKTLNVFVETAHTIEEEITVKRVVYSIQKQMEAE